MRGAVQLFRCFLCWLVVHVLECTRGIACDVMNQTCCCVFWIALPEEPLGAEVKRN